MLRKPISEASRRKSALEEEEDSSTFNIFPTMLHYEREQKKHGIDRQAFHGQATPDMNLFQELRHFAMERRPPQCISATSVYLKQRLQGMKTN
ncbi:hypothetical protein CDAR_307441 [Caerostris darwini]|uniref:Uncharacterized protein n=1 Tax=Caerostris darwini TaxID=1538125 RepID=A0AAV4T6G9_9ARAC|nr:hypothetical protein CDAR_307441 [Caerostris darwini]